MSSRHAYGSDSRTRFKVFSYLAMTAAFAHSMGEGASKLLLGIPIIARLSGEAGLLRLFAVTTCFSVAYLLYDRLVWRHPWQNTPDLSGTWVGVVLPNYMEWPHLEVTTIDQTWSEIRIHGNGYFKASQHDQWSTERKLGILDSTAASFGDISAGCAVVTIAYEHKGFLESQPNFQGSMTLRYDVIEDKLEGKYFTNRIEDGRQGSLGPIRLIRVSRSILRQSEALQLAANRLPQLEAEVLSSRVAAHKRTNAQN